MELVHYITSDVFTIEKLNEILTQGQKIQLSEEARANIVNCRMYLDDKMAKQADPIYGINTGFGSLCNVKIDSDNLSQLQENLMMSHACGTGEIVPEEIVKIMLLLKVKSLSYGNSGFS